MRRKLVLVGGTFVVAFVAALVVVLASDLGGDFLPGPGGSAPPDEPDGTPTPVVEGTAEPDGEPQGDLVEFVDDEGGYALSYPEDWERIEVDDPQVRLLATPNRRDSLFVRLIDLEADVEVAEGDLPAFREYTDRIVQGGEGVEILDEPVALELGGLPALYYLYTFEDPSSGQRGVHSHYFVFEGRTVISIVMQALPTDRFAGLAPTFKAIVDSFEGSV